MRGLRPATRLRSTTLTASDLRLPRMLARGPVLPLIGMLVLVLGMALLPAIQSPTPSAPAGQSSAGAAPAISSPLLDLLFPLVPWMLVFGFIWFFVFRLFRGNLRRMFDSQPTLHRAHTADITAEGVVIVDHVSRFEYRWDAFPAYCESPNLFMIYVSPHQFHMIPKRAFASPQELDACRYMLHTLIGDREPAFPVLPIAAAGRTTDSAVRPGQA